MEDIFIKIYTKKKPEPFLKYSYIQDKKNGKTLLHYSIELNKNNFIKSLIPVSNLEIVDNNSNTPIHTAIIYNSPFAMELIKLNPTHITNNQGFSILDLAIIHNNKKITQKLIKDNYPINYSTIKIIANKNPSLFLQITPKGKNEQNENYLFELFKNNNYTIELIQELLQKDSYSFLNLDSNRNTTGHIYLTHCIKFNEDILDLIISANPVYLLSIPNRSNLSILDLLLVEHNATEYFKNIITKYHFDVNSYDYFGNTLLHRVIGMEKIFPEIPVNEILTFLIKNNADVHIPNINGNTPLHLLCKENKVNIIKNINCPDLLIKNKTGKTPISYLPRNTLPEIYTHFKNSGYFNKNSNHYLEKCLIQIHNPIINNKQKSNYSLFTGSGLNELMGFIYLRDKYKNLCFLNYDIKLEKIQGTEKYVVDYEDYNIIWDKGILTFPDKLYNSLSDKIKSCNYIVIPITLIASVVNESLHANYLIIDTKKKTIERFEPHGGMSLYFYHTDLLDTELIKKLNFGYKYLRPIDYLPVVGFQSIQSFENYMYLLNRIGDPEGFCATWGIWYIDLRLSNSGIDQKTLVKQTMKEIMKSNKKFTEFIRDYSAFIVKTRNTMIKKYLGINNFVEEKMTKNNAKKISKFLSKKFT